MNAFGSAGRFGLLILTVDPVAAGSSERGQYGKLHCWPWANMRAQVSRMVPTPLHRVSVETFDQNTGAITSSFAKYNGTRNSYSVDGIFAGDAGLVTHYIRPKGEIYSKRKYEVMNPGYRQWIYRRLDATNARCRFGTVPAR
jgi:hypothetical protein